MRAQLRLPPLVFAAVVWTGAARASETVRVELADPSSNPALNGMQMSLDHATAKAGQIAVQAINKSAALVHEVLLIKTGLTGGELPYDAKRDVVAESKIASLGEIEDLRPGRSGSLTVSLKPGSYLLACNQPGHMHAGMWAKLQVVP